LGDGNKKEGIYFTFRNDIDNAEPTPTAVPEVSSSRIMVYDLIKHMAYI